ncbi:style cell-cycle inhibitor 1-A isoform X4 [Salvia hispanica]|uniref:style cell-cycle inhibitor 1-A isoform X4 n=1 Tax=Salvia hispanica TaxID=49212 RepID=UPI002009D34E|nr:style cell-cycle inhibitor 1-A isoform X4 [Salvia hispanica]
MTITSSRDRLPLREMNREAKGVEVRTMIRNTSLVRSINLILPPSTILVKKSSGKRKHKGHKHDKLPLDIQELTDDDYFSKNNEFSTWLKEEKRKFFADLSSEAARSLFKEFVAEWNSQELEPHYYDGIATAPRTSHKWNIKK